MANTEEFLTKIKLVNNVISSYDFVKVKAEVYLHFSFLTLFSVLL